ncbi:glycosyltransferase family 4 protein [Actinopolymorpha rutila]|uniref:Glycosyltransferase involved in cell wall biosynthesis n=1 Tax=Actinopolymorpha rutila TaxID=446787 RepID=A0A852Z769_9ACTN|nr:glycosyltransferase family 4 protein [Actinopolymorpha rutila]NYH87722.1 glycosyltransferase involved in cell wall biosynthesis [Actinopolymorpha rutila]
MRVLVLWNQLTGYMKATLECLAEQPEVELHVVAFPSATDAPFSASEARPGKASYYTFTDDLDVGAIHDDIDPDALIVCGWSTSAYRRLARRSRALRILYMDNQWLGTAKQRAGVIVSRWYLGPAYDVALVPGERQAHFARLLGFREDDIWRGGLSGDYHAFAARPGQVSASRREFLYVGRLHDYKGVGVLAEAFRRYSSLVPDPWDLTVCGTGPMQKVFEQMPGVRHLGFVQPSNLPDIVQGSGAFVMPSTFEPWGVVIHEACAAGLPVICTPACGAAAALVEDHWNGYLVEPGSAQSLCEAMLRMHCLPDVERRRMGDNSALLARRFTPDRWAATLVSRIDRRLPGGSAASPHRPRRRVGRGSSIA